MNGLAVLLVGTSAFLPGLQTSPPLVVRSRTAVITCKENDEAKGAVGGAVLGGLLLGPFGALWGSQIGANMGANNRAKRQQSEQLAAMGLTKDVIELARKTAAELQEAEQSLAIVEGAQRSQKSLVDTHARTMETAYAAAEAALRSGDEDAARTQLELRQAAKAKKEFAEADLAQATQRVATMQSSVAALAERASRIEQSIATTASSATMGRASASSVDLDDEDPLEKKFRDLGA